MYIKQTLYNIIISQTYYYEWIVQNVPSVDVIKWSINVGKLLSTVFYVVDGQKYISADMIELSTVFFSFSLRTIV